MRTLRVVLSFLFVLTVQAQETTQKFQAERFLDMLGKTFDPNVAYLDLLAALHKRMNLGTPNGNNATGPPMTADAGVANPNTIADASPNCPVAPVKPGTTVTYTSDTRIMGSRAFYQCEKGYSGRSLFILCQDGGQWTDSAMYQGCAIVDCGSPLPTVPNGNPAYTATTYGAVALYSCDSGYKVSSPDANVTCQENGQWSSPSFQCEKIPTAPSVPALTPATIASMMAGSASGPGSDTSGKNSPNPMMLAMMKAMSGMAGAGMPSGFPSPPQNKPAPPAPAAPSMPPMPGSPQDMASMIAKMFPGFAPPTPPTTTTTTPAPVVQHQNMMGGFQLPSHLQSLLPNGISNPKGMNPQDLMTLASIGLGSNSAAAAPRGISQLLGTMNPMSLLSQSMGMGGGGAAGQAGATPGAPADPEKMAEQREEMMKRAMMASAMQSMMRPRATPNNNNNNNSSSPNGNAQKANPAMDMMALMALSGGLSGQGGSGGGGGAMDPLAAMFGGMSPSMLGMNGGGGGGLFGGGGSGGLFGDLFGSAK